jgi:hypothetical protein
MLELIVTVVASTGSRFCNSLVLTYAAAVEIIAIIIEGKRFTRLISCKSKNDNAMITMNKEITVKKVTKIVGNRV